MTDTVLTVSERTAERIEDVREELAEEEPSLPAPTTDRSCSRFLTRARLSSDTDTVTALTKTRIPTTQRTGQSSDCRITYRSAQPQEALMPSEHQRGDATDGYQSDPHRHVREWPEERLLKLEPMVESTAKEYSSRAIS